MIFYDIVSYHMNVFHAIDAKENVFIPSDVQRTFLCHELG